MIFAIYGLYDYYRISKLLEVEQFLKGAITTIKVNAKKYRNENEASMYCLKHKLKHAGYHITVTNQLKMLFKITGDSYFERLYLFFEFDLLLEEEKETYYFDSIQEFLKKE